MERSLTIPQRMAAISAKNIGIKIRKNLEIILPQKYANNEMGIDRKYSNIFDSLSPTTLRTVEIRIRIGKTATQSWIYVISKRLKPVKPITLDSVTPRTNNRITEPPNTRL